MKSISVCIICKNEEKNIARMLESVKSRGLEIVIADTGSTDRTKQIASEYTNQIYDFEWQEDFSLARNFVASKATNDYILMLDADEWIEEIDFESAAALFRNYPNAVGSVWVDNMTGSPQKPGPSIRCHLERLYDRRKYQYVGAIHERLRPIDAGVEFETLLVEIVLGHSGYCMEEEVMKAKAERNLRLLLKEREANPENPYILYQLGKGNLQLGEYNRAEEWFKEALGHEPDPELEYVQDMIISYGELLRGLGQKKEALELMLKYKDSAVLADLVYLRGAIFEENERFQDAANEYQRALGIKEYSKEGTNTVLPCLGLGRILHRFGQYEEARMFLEPLKGIPEADRLLEYC